MRFKEFLLENDSGLKSFETELQKKYGLTHLRLYKKGNDLTLDMIVVPKDKRKQGIGSKVLEDITHYADVNGLRTLLTTAVKDTYHGTTSATRLKSFYKKFGFVENKGRNKDFTTTHNMIREPKKNVLKESEEQTHLGYKIVNFDGKEAYSIADKKVKYSLKKNDIHTGNIFLGTSTKYATEYYSTDSDDPEDPEELLLTYEFSPSDIKKGNIEDKDYMTGGSEIIVSKAKLVGVYNITKKKTLVESEERKHGKLLSEIKPTLKTVMIFRARDDKSDEFDSKDYVTLSSKFALEHAESNHVYSEEPQIVIRATVPTNQLAEASNPGEWFYIGPKIHGDVVYKTLGPEDYDGKIIDLKFARKLKL